MFFVSCPVFGLVGQSGSESHFVLNFALQSNALQFIQLYSYPFNISDTSLFFKLYITPSQCTLLKDVKHCGFHYFCIRRPNQNRPESVDGSHQLSVVT